MRHFYAGQRVKGWAEGRRGRDAGRGLASVLAVRVHHAAVPGLHVGSRNGQRCLQQDVELFTGSDRYGAKESCSCCVLTGDRCWRGGHARPADLLGHRGDGGFVVRDGGYHIPVDNDVGLRVGRELAVWSWPRYQQYFDGTATIRP